jgi:hypothetical protein
VGVNEGVGVGVNEGVGVGVLVVVLEVVLEVVVEVVVVELETTTEEASVAISLFPVVDGVGVDNKLASKVSGCNKILAVIRKKGTVEG